MCLPQLREPVPSEQLAAPRETERQRGDVAIRIGLSSVFPNAGLHP